MTTREQRRRDWAARITDFRASGMTMAAWCDANGCTISQLKYWLYKAKNVSSTTSSPSTRFMPITVNNRNEVSDPTPPLVVRVGQATIELRAGFDPGLLREVVQALESPC